jgi:hypothetical protein
MGADEQLGGYRYFRKQCCWKVTLIFEINSRYRTRWDENGWEGVVEELEMEVNRISKRNLGIKSSPVV